MNTTLDFLLSYLGNRILIVEISGHRSLGPLVTMGVPQVSILGSFLFLVYINDLPNLIKDSQGIVLFVEVT